MESQAFQILLHPQPVVPVMNQDEEGFQSEPEIILIQADQNESESTNESENDENEQPSNENDGAEVDDEVKLFSFLNCSYFLIILDYRMPNLFRALDQFRSSSTLFPSMWSSLRSSMHRSMACRRQNQMSSMQCPRQTRRYSCALL